MSCDTSEAIDCYDDTRCGWKAEGMSELTYRVWGFGAKRIVAMLALMAAIGVAGLVAAVVATGPPLWFVGLYLLALVWNAYWFLFRIAYRLDLSQDELSWHAPFRSGTVNLRQIDQMRPQRLGSTFEVIALRQGRPLLVMVQKGFADFASEVQARAPHIGVRIGSLARLGNKFPGPSSLRRD